MTTPSSQFSRSTKKKKQQENKRKGNGKKFSWRDGVTEGTLQNVIIGCSKNKASQFLIILEKLLVISSEKVYNHLSNILQIYNLKNKPDDNNDFCRILT